MKIKIIKRAIVSFLILACLYIALALGTEIIDIPYLELEKVAEKKLNFQLAYM
jgi:hypothetical protein